MGSNEQEEQEELKELKEQNFRQSVEIDGLRSYNQRLVAVLEEVHGLQPIIGELMVKIRILLYEEKY